MAAMKFFLAGVGVSLVLAVGLVVLLRAPLSRLAHEICGTKVRGDFWVLVVSICTVIATLFSAMLGWRPQGNPEELSLFWGVVNQIKFALVALFASVILVALFMHSFVREFERRYYSGLPTAPPEHVEGQPLDAQQ